MEIFGRPEGEARWRPKVAPTNFCACISDQYLSSSLAGTVGDQVPCARGTRHLFWPLRALNCAIDAFPMMMASSGFLLGHFTCDNASSIDNPRAWTNHALRICPARPLPPEQCTTTGSHFWSDSRRKLLVWWPPSAGVSLLAPQAEGLNKPEQPRYLGPRYALGR
jgi:hypothetical protein